MARSHLTSQSQRLSCGSSSPSTRTGYVGAATDIGHLLVVCGIPVSRPPLRPTSREARGREWGKVRIGDRVTATEASCLGATPHRSAEVHVCLIVRLRAQTESQARPGMLTSREGSSPRHCGLEGFLARRGQADWELEEVGSACGRACPLEHVPERALPVAEGGEVVFAAEHHDVEVALSTVSISPQGRPLAPAAWAEISHAYAEALLEPGAAKGRSRVEHDTLPPGLDRDDRFPRDEHRAWDEESRRHHQRGHPAALAALEHVLDDAHAPVRGVDAVAVALRDPGFNVHRRLSWLRNPQDLRSAVRFRRCFSLIQSP